MKTHAIYDTKTGDIHQVVTTNTDLHPDNVKDGYSAVEVEHHITAHTHKIDVKKKEPVNHTPEVVETPVYANGMVVRSLADDLAEIGLTSDTADQWVQKNIKDFDDFKKLLTVFVKRSLSK